MHEIGSTAPVGEVYVNGVWAGVPGATAPTSVIINGGKAETTVPTAVTDGQAVWVWYDEYGRQVIAGYDLSSGSITVTPVAATPRATFVSAQSALTAPGVGAAVDVSIYSMITWQIVIAAINTSVDVRIEGTSDGTSWFNMDDAGVDTQYVANDTYSLRADSRQVKQTRLRFVSEVGGAAVTVTGTVMAGN